eukprot:7378221-Prymnesium_polylepis.1
MARVASCTATRVNTHGTAAICGAFFLQPLVFGVEDSPSECVDFVLQTSGSFDIRSGQVAIDSAEPLPAMHCSGNIRSSTEEWCSRDAAPSRANMPLMASTDAAYDAFAEASLLFGPTFRMLADLWVKDDEIPEGVARLERKSRWSAAHLHPADVDSSVQSSLVLSPRASNNAKGEARQPFTVDEALLSGGRSTHLWASSVQQSLEHTDVLLLDRGRQAGARLTGFRTRVVKVNSTNSIA